VVTAAPLDALDLPEAAIAFVAWFRAESLLVELGLLTTLPEFVDALEPLVTVPETAFEDCVPLAT
jgi:hypothetical protein